MLLEATSVDFRDRS